jgi:tetratricopeptide (TPR) repeat protein
VTLRARQYLLPAIALLSLVVLVAWITWESVRPRPTLSEVMPLLRAGKFEKAQQQLRAYLREYPRDDYARYQIVECQLARYDRLDPPNPGLLRDALADVRQIRLGADPQSDALVQFQLGKIQSRLLHYDEAEKAWVEALRLDPLVPEAGWLLVQLYDWQGRLDEARALALRLQAIEPDQRDRVGWLLELVREDVHRPASRGLINSFEPIVRDNPKDLHTTLALGVAYAREGLVDRGLECLRDAVKAHPHDPGAWLALFTGLEEAGQMDVLAAALDRLPPELTDDPRFVKARGVVAQERRDWSTAEAMYRRALEFWPQDLSVVYRLARVLRNAGKTREADRYGQQARTYSEARKELRALYEEIEPIARSLAPDSRPDLYRHIAELRERMGLRDEVEAWKRLIADGPHDSIRKAQSP